MEAIEARAVLRFFRISPHKTRLVADMVRGRKVEEAIRLLTFTNKKGARVLLKLLKSAVANAEEKKVEDTELLEISQVWVSPGPYKRKYFPRARGRADMLRQPTSHITIVVREDLEAKEAEAKRRADAEAKKAKKKAAKKASGAKGKDSSKKKDDAAPVKKADKTDDAAPAKKADSKTAKAPGANKKKKKED